MWREAVGLQRGEVIVGFGQGEKVRLVNATADFKASAPGFFGPGVGGLFGDVADEFVHPVWVNFDGDEKGDHSGDES